jgi:multiple antibiotic resistance protein
VAGEPFIVPLAIPLIAGPSTMAVLMLMASQHPGRRADWTLALLIAWSCGTVILLLANRLRTLVGPRGLLAIERLMGMMLLVLAVQMSIDGLHAFFRHS